MLDSLNPVVIRELMSNIYDYGRVDRPALVVRNGRNNDIDTGGDNREALAPIAADWTPPSTAIVGVLDGNSTDDTAMGSGATSVFVWGLDANWLPQTYTADTQGTTAFNMDTINGSFGYADRGQTWIRHYDLWTLAGTNVAEIYTQLNSQLQTAIFPGSGFSNQAMFSIPAGMIGLVFDVWANKMNGDTGNFEMYLLARELGGPWHELASMGLIQGTGATGGNSHIVLPGGPIIERLPPKSDVQLVGEAATSNNDVAGGFKVLLLPESNSDLWLKRYNIAT